MNKNVKRAINLMGGTAQAARKLGVKPPTVSQWLAGTRPVPIKKCIEIEAAVSGAVTREELLPDFDWAVFASRTVAA